MHTNLRRNGGFTDDGLLDDTALRLLGSSSRRARVARGARRRVGLSSPAVAERIKRLEGAGVIRGYHADIDPRALGYTLGVVIRIRPAPRQIADVAALARDSAEVVECHRVTGDDCYVVTAFVRDVDHLEEVIDRSRPTGRRRGRSCSPHPSRREESRCTQTPRG